MSRWTESIAILIGFMLGAAATAEPAPTVKFMGVEAEAASVAFVCDGSRWTKKTIDDLSTELLRTVEAMTPDQRFAVVFFADDKASGPDDGRPIAATDENKRKLRHWLGDVTLGDKSTPIPALTSAFDAKPDAVFFVSSGEFDDYDGVAGHVEVLNTGRTVRVYPVGLFPTIKQDDSRAFVRFLKKLADDHRGEFRLVYADALRRGD